MKLYYSAGSCSTSCHITLEESGLAYEAVEVDWDNPADPNISLVPKLNPMGTLPILITDTDGQLDQNLAIHCYVADLAPAKQLLPAAGTAERAQALNWLSFVASDLHKSFSPIFGLESVSPDKKAQDAVRAWAVGNVNKGLSTMDSRLAGKDYLMGKNFTVADAYAFIVTNWTQWVGIPIEGFKNLKAYLARVAERPAVRKVYKEEGL